MANPVDKIRTFLNEVATELKKSSWPTRKELVDSTILVMVTVAILGVFTAMADVVFLKIIGILTKSA